MRRITMKEINRANFAGDKTHVYFEVKPWSNAPMNGEVGELYAIDEESPYPVVLFFGDKRNRVAYKVDDVTLLHMDKIYPY
jgi:hypothetical protein